MTFRDKMKKAAESNWKDPEYRSKQYQNNPVLRGDLKGESNPMYGKGFSGESNPMYGKKHSQETLQKLRGRKVSEDTRSKISTSHRGRIWINDGVSKNKIVFPEDLDKYPGWSKGRI